MKGKLSIFSLGCVTGIIVTCIGIVATWTIGVELYRRQARGYYTAGEEQWLADNRQSTTLPRYANITIPSRTPSPSPTPILEEMIVAFYTDTCRSLAVKWATYYSITSTGITELDKLGAENGLQLVEPGISQKVIELATAVASGDYENTFRLDCVYVFTFASPTMPISQLAQLYTDNSNVEYANPNYSPEPPNETPQPLGTLAPIPSPYATYIPPSP